MGRQEQIIQERLKKLKELREKGINPYPSKYDIKNTSSEIHKKYGKLKNGEKTKDSVKIAGRVMSIRDLGKIAFSVLDDGHGKIQLTIQETATPESAVKFFKQYIDVGDFVGVEGTVIRTERGELSVLVKKADILSKSILPLPEKWHGLQDDEERLRKRYLDILMNPQVRELFVKKSKFWQTIRHFLISREFLEVETPVLENSAGGASATPFITHHNALDIDVFLRISMGELWQKKLMVAGYPKTFEIGRQFRNEGMDAEHLQDYTQMEFYWAYANYEQGMEIVEEMYKEVAQEVFDTTKFKIGEHEFDLGKKWKTIDYAETIKKDTGINISKATEKEMEKKIHELKMDHDQGASRVQLIDTLWKYCRRKISGPVFLVGHPVDVSPLAKRSDSDPEKVERFQVILGGSEVGNGYSELNDPIDQEERFKEQQKMKEAGDKEAHTHDEEFVEALKYGMPPTCGFGVSERLFAFLAGKPIRETVIFPLMKPQEKKEAQHGSHRKK
ncbi:lysine--tRNA ligase [Candidatus Pacearchaeota archaeon]|nr:lysine--tRNA ligase [Candidatus Pacearchaeota archaeon]